jgi:hypothetical protein
MSVNVTCPKCGSAIDSGAGFGMATCAQCGEFILLGDSGQAQIEGAALPPIPSPENLPPIPEVNKATAESPAEFEFTIKQVQSPETGSTSVTAALPPVSEINFNPPPNYVAPEVRLPPKPQAVAAPGFQDVIDFANEVQPSSGFGALVYDVSISGIDTAESREDLLDCLRDKRLGLEFQHIVQQIKDGELTLRQLNPVKASVLLNRLRHLPFKISWASQQLVKSLLAFVVTVLLALSVFAPQSKASDWARHEVNLKGYASRIRNMQEDIQALIIKKSQNKNPVVRDEILKEIILKNQELQKTYQDYKAEKEHIRFEHPEQGDKTERKYRHLKLKSLEELENEVGIDGQLSRLKRKVEDTYPSADASPSPELKSGDSKTPIKK